MALHDATLPHLRWELYQRWKSYGDGNAIVSSNDDKTSYCQLVRQVESKYAALSNNELQAREVVALGDAMGVEMVATLVACWLRGLTVVLVDGSQPEARRRRLLGIAAPSLIVDHDGEYLTGPPESIPTALIVDGAYMVFTSGSTGKPKAILGSHQGLAHFICWQSREFGITPHDRFAQLTAVGFDVIYRSVLTPLFSGAQLWIPPHDVSEGEAMLEWLGRHRINALSDLRCIFSGGEMLHSKVVQAICRQWAFTGQLVNLYGPSETTLAKCFYRCQSGDEVRGSIPVGLPLPNTEVWIMDGSRRCAPVEPGEVVIRTPYRALGYVNSTGTASWPTANAQKSEDYLYYTRDLGGISHFFLNYPDKVTADWSVALDFYCRQVQDLIQEAPEQPVWLGGWSMGGNIAVAVAERLAGGCPQIRPRLIVLDSLSGYCQGVRQNRDVTEDVWSPYHPENIMYRQFAMAGYSRHPYYHYVDCLRHLDAMQVTHCHYPVLLIKCLEPIGQFYSDMPDNYWGKLPTVSWCTASQLTTTACSLIRLTFIRWPTLYAAHWTMVANMAINTTLRHIDGD